MFDGLTVVGGDDGKMAEIPGIWEIASNTSNCQTWKVFCGRFPDTQNQLT